MAISTSSGTCQGISPWLSDRMKPPPGPAWAMALPYGRFRLRRGPAAHLDAVEVAQQGELAPAGRLDFREVLQAADADHGGAGPGDVAEDGKRPSGGQVGRRRPLDPGEGAFRDGESGPEVSLPGNDGRGGDGVEIADGRGAGLELGVGPGDAEILVDLHEPLEEVRSLDHQIEIAVEAHLHHGQGEGGHDHADDGASSPTSRLHESRVAWRTLTRQGVFSISGGSSLRIFSGDRG